MSRRILWMAAALVALAACEKAQEESVSQLMLPVDEGDPRVLTNMIDLFEPGSAGPITIGADFGGTRAHIEMNGEGTFATWIWKSGDSFTMYGVNDARNKYQLAKFTTSESGASADFTSQSGFSFAPPYYTVFPSPSKVSFNSGKILLGVNIPAEQEAVPGGIKDGYTIAFAFAQNTTDYLHFLPAVSLVRFRMSGAVASQVKTVTLKGTSYMAGDIVLQGEDDGTATILDDIFFTTDERSNTVTLTGDFVAGQDYYLVLRPKTQSRFQMIFADDANHYTTKTANNFTFPVGRISDFGTIDLGDAFEDEIINYEPIQYMAASAGAAKPVTLAVVPDGFTEGEMTDYVNLAKRGIDALMNTEPYKTYSQYFNVWILRAASKESGASVTDGNGTITAPVNNYFGSRWGEGYRDMTADADDLFEFVSKKCPDITGGIHSISEVPVLLIINDERYGGICHSFSDGKGYGMVPYTASGGSLSWSYPNVTPSTDDPLPTPVTGDIMNANAHRTTAAEYAAVGRNTGDWRNTLVHEFGGHCFGRLGDEYWPDNMLTYESGPISDQRWDVPFSLNLASDPTAVPWASEVLGYPLETLIAKDPNYGRIGIFQGGGTKMFGRWRSEKISCMIDNRFYFSAWQRMLIVKRIMTLSGSTFDAASFWAKDVTIDPVRDIQSSQVVGSQTRTFREVPLLPPPVLHETL